MKKLSLLLTSLVFVLSSCTIDYTKYKENKDEEYTEYVLNSDGTYTRNLSSNGCSNVEVYYLDLKNDKGNTKIGDSTYLKCGDIDIVIDAGIKNVGTNTVVPFLKEKVTDKKIELVISTHTDNDHMGGFVGLSGKEGVLSITDFTYDYILESGNEATTGVYNEFKTLTSVASKVCTASESMVGTNSCAKTFKMGSITLDILNTSFYDSTKASSNNKSVVTLLTYNNVKFLFPGDLEDDEYLANNIGHVDIYKASHHGASSANSATLLQAITPDIIILSTDGDNSYGIPQQASLDRMYAVTDNIYATFTTGTIKITSDGNTYNFESNNQVKFQNTEWFQTNRVKN